jgi:hypothetical protein
MGYGERFSKRLPMDEQVPILYDRKGRQEMKISRTIVIVFMLMTGMVFYPYSGRAEQAILHDFDRQACYASCRCDSHETVTGCFSCKQECDRKFWRAFDRETGGDRSRQREGNQ